MANFDLVTGCDLRLFCVDLRHFAYQGYTNMSLGRSAFLIPVLTCRRAMCNSDTK